MKPWELFNLIKNTDYKTSGDSIEYLVKTFDDEKLIRVIFQESHGTRDWLNNFNFPVKIYKDQTSPLKLARGWGNAYKSAEDDILTDFESSRKLNPNYGVQVIGWSYGGAMAVICAEDISYNYEDILPDVVTFGAPKPVYGKKSKKYIASMCGTILQYADRNDMVPYCIPLPGYKQMNKIKIDKGFNLIKFFQPNKYHKTYGDESLYDGVEICE